MRERMNLTASKDWLRAYLLYLGGVPVAFWIGTQYRGVFFSDFMGHDSAYAKHSPGMFLVMKVINGLYGADGNSRVTRVDFGVGDAQYKEVLGNVCWTDAFIYIYGPSRKGRALNAAQLPVVLLDKLGRAALKRLHLQNRVKKTLLKSVSKV
jgi:CelD/BcsL family acetyltransferase involved in cellulose biosynthesis